MRRSVRDAVVGFSLLGGVIVFSGLTFWLKGFKLSANTWSVSANFTDASGLAEGTPVTFRGIQIGNVQKISFTSKDVEAKIRINNNNIILFKPIIAKVETSSLLGGDTQIAMVSNGKSLENINYLPKDENCPNQIILCEGDSLEGSDLASLSKITNEINKFLNTADSKEIMEKMVTSIEQFESTQENLDELIRLSKLELSKAQPIIQELNKTVDHMNSILGSIDDPEVLRDIKASTSSIKSFTAKIDNISDKVDEIVSDEDLAKAFKDAAIGIGRLFNDIYK